jgi:hypothetical protein
LKPSPLADASGTISTPQLPGLEVSFHKALEIRNLRFHPPIRRYLWGYSSG